MQSNVNYTLIRKTILKLNCKKKSHGLILYKKSHMTIVLGCIYDIDRNIFSSCYTVVRRDK